jgi:hypothetical protein
MLCSSVCLSTTRCRLLTSRRISIRENDVNWMGGVRLAACKSLYEPRDFSMIGNAGFGEWGSGCSLFDRGILLEKAALRVNRECVGQFISSRDRREWFFALIEDAYNSGRWTTDSHNHSAGTRQSSTWRTWILWKRSWNGFVERSQSWIYYLKYSTWQTTDTMRTSLVSQVLSFP